MCVSVCSSFDNVILHRALGHTPTHTLHCLAITQSSSPNSSTSLPPCLLLGLSLSLSLSNSLSLSLSLSLYLSLSLSVSLFVSVPLFLTPFRLFFCLSAFSLCLPLSLSLSLSLSHAHRSGEPRVERE